MRSIVLSQTAQDAIVAYVRAYRQYFTDLYTDTGIFSETQILQYYEEQVMIREREIIDLIEKHLSADEVLGRTQKNTLLLSWKTKVILLEWKDQESIRIITDIQIR